MSRCLLLLLPILLLVPMCASTDNETTVQRRVLGPVCSENERFEMEDCPPAADVDRLPPMDVIKARQEKQERYVWFLKHRADKAVGTDAFDYWWALYRQAGDVWDALNKMQECRCPHQSQDLRRQWLKYLRDCDPLAYDTGQWPEPPHPLPLELVAEWTTSYEANEPDIGKAGAGPPP